MALRMVGPGRTLGGWEPALCTRGCQQLGSLRAIPDPYFLLPRQALSCGPHPHPQPRALEEGREEAAHVLLPQTLEGVTAPESREHHGPEDFNHLLS